jgi:hypothetical protein
MGSGGCIWRGVSGTLDTQPEEYPHAMEAAARQYWPAGQVVVVREH